METIYLINLIKNSYSLFEEEKEKLIKRLGDFDKKKIEKLIKIFETEKNRFEQIESDYNKTVENIGKQYKIKIGEGTLEYKPQENTKNKLKKIK